MIKKLFFVFACLPLYVYSASSTTAAPQPKSLLKLVFEYIHKNRAHLNLSLSSLELKSALWTCSTVRRQRDIFLTSKLDVAKNCLYDLIGNFISKKDLLDGSSDERIKIQGTCNNEQIAVTDNKCVVFSWQRGNPDDECISYYDLTSKPDDNGRLVPIKTFNTSLGVRAFALNSNGSRLLLLFANKLEFIDVATDDRLTIPLGEYAKTFSNNGLSQIAFSDSGEYVAYLGTKLVLGGDDVKKIKVYRVNATKRTIEKITFFCPKTGYRGSALGQNIAFNGDTLYFTASADTIKLYDPVINRYISSLTCPDSKIQTFAVSTDGATVKAFADKEPRIKPANNLLVTWHTLCLSDIKKEPSSGDNGLEDLSSKY